MSSFLFGPDSARLISLTTFAATFFVSIFELLAFAWIWNHNGRVYRMTTFTLSQKYQVIIMDNFYYKKLQTKLLSGFKKY
jgi:hypothetical protein